MIRAILFTCALYVVSATSEAVVDPRAALEQAAELIQAGEYSYARTVVEPALIHPRLTSAERARAFYLRGYAFVAQGMPVSARKDYNRALEFNENNLAVLVGLGDLHARGLGTVPNRSLAFRLFAKAAEHGSAQGQLFAGRAHLLGEGTTFDVQEARRLLTLAAEQGQMAALPLLGASFRMPYAEPPQPQVAAQWYRQAMDSGDAGAAVALAHMMKSGELGEVRVEDACAMFEASAERDSGAAHASLAHCFLSGEGREQDYAAAKHHFERASALQHVDGYLGLAYLFESGAGVPRDLSKAARWYERAAHRESARGQLGLAQLLLAQGDVETEAEAIGWLARATEEGDADAANAYAWVLATSNHSAHRNGERAVQFAEYAVAQEETASYLDTLAAAYAEVGRWEEAAATQVRAIEAAGSNDPDLLARLDRYSLQQPWRR